MRNIHQDDIKSHTKGERSIHDGQKGHPEISTPISLALSSTDNPMKPMLPRTWAQIYSHSSRKTHAHPPWPDAASKIHNRNTFQLGISRAWRERRSFTPVTSPMHNNFAEHHSISNSNVPYVCDRHLRMERGFSSEKFQESTAFWSTALGKPNRYWHANRNYCATCIEAGNSLQRGIIP